jgi:hypothetical protein
LCTLAAQAGVRASFVPKDSPAFLCSKISKLILSGLHFLAVISVGGFIGSLVPTRLP